MAREEILQTHELLPSFPSASGAGCPAFVVYKLLSPNTPFTSEMEGEGNILKGTSNWFWVLGCY